MRTSLDHETSQEARSFPDRLVASDAYGRSARPPLVLELIRAPPQGGAEPLLLAELVELRADLGARGVEPGFRNAIRSGLDVLAGLYAARTEVGTKFDELREKEGLGAALRWRADQFKD